MAISNVHCLFSVIVISVLLSQKPKAKSQKPKAKSQMPKAKILATPAKNLALAHRVYFANLLKFLMK
ncbi:hypothetical protein [Thalassotalea sp. PLHSN55]|uniref:hypothetical protein n=1 Tax=Thalassotalea sp. PLHSN55 TaxID=3435888 RepID=UPI003F83AA83